MHRVSLAAQPAAPSSHLAAQAHAGPGPLAARALGAAIDQLPVLIRAAQDADLGQVAEKELVRVCVKAPAVHLRSVSTVRKRVAKSLGAHRALKATASSISLAKVWEGCLVAECNGAPTVHMHWRKAVSAWPGSGTSDACR